MNKQTVIRTLHLVTKVEVVYDSQFVYRGKKVWGIYLKKANRVIVVVEDGITLLHELAHAFYQHEITKCGRNFNYSETEVFARAVELIDLVENFDDIPAVLDLGKEKWDKDYFIYKKELFPNLKNEGVSTAYLYTIYVRLLTLSRESNNNNFIKKLGKRNVHNNN
jgi:hypothetical protein